MHVELRVVAYNRIMNVEKEIICEKMANWC